MSAQSLRQKYTRVFAGMKKYNGSTAWLIVFMYIAQLMAAVALGHILLTLSASFFSVIGVFLLMIFVATRMRGLNNIVHECSHATFASDRTTNVRIGKLCASLLFNSFVNYRDEHLSHHAHLGDYEQDLDLQGIENLRLHDTLTMRVLIRHITTPFLLRHLPYYLGLNLSPRDGRAYQLLQYAVVGVVAVITALAPLTGILMLIVPFVLIYSALNYWADCMDHAGLVPTDDDLDGSRNVLAPGTVRWLFFPRNDCFHLVHHLFPHIPARHLETSHERLLEDQQYVSRSNAVRGLAGAAEGNEGLSVPAE